MTGMTRYYFDVRDGDTLAIDEEGMELRDLAAAQAEAAESFADVVRDVARDMAKNGGVIRMAIEVRDDKGDLLQVGYTFRNRRLD
ncbi:hypothetical protein [Bradyrhizobium arachidis]|uniref:DUF6894 family protein n=1 Tax=Bradyrhizobium TaxID=374 RepID=UPI002867CDA2|nr:hypothetical protein [Bradyrhizobium arachidis]